MGDDNRVPLRRVLGAPTALFIGMGVAIGSGIFRTPGDVAAQLQAPWLIVVAWIFGGLFVLMAGMVTAEVATRFPRAGGEYVFLREAYGEFVAFFFGWAYTVFIIGGGLASIAAAFGDFGCGLFGVGEGWSGLMGASALVVVTGVNLVGLSAGATTQNVLTVLKVAALAAVIVVGFVWGEAPIEFFATPMETTGRSMPAVILTGVIPVLWAYSGSTDSVKMAEEIRDVRRTLPRALIGSAAALTTLYVLFNLALMRILPAHEMAGLSSVPGEAMGRIFGPSGASTMLVVAMVVCMGSLSSAILSTVRVTFALARDGLAFRFMGRMSRTQTPVGAMLVVAGVAIVLVLTHRFGEVLEIYFFAGAVLFGLAYGSLIVLRLRERRFPEHVYRCPAGIAMATVLILIQLAYATNIVIDSPVRAAYTTGLLVALAAFYFVWKRFAR